MTAERSRERSIGTGETKVEKTTESATDAPETSAAERAAPASARAADFGIDTTAQTTGEAIRAYLRNLRNGELGALPALLGLAASGLTYVGAAAACS